MGCHAYSYNVQYISLSLVVCTKVLSVLLYNSLHASYVVVNKYLINGMLRRLMEP